MYINSDVWALSPVYVQGGTFSPFWALLCLYSIFLEKKTIT